MVLNLIVKQYSIETAIYIPRPTYQLPITLQARRDQLRALPNVLPTSDIAFSVQQITPAPTLPPVQEIPYTIPFVPFIVGRLI